MILDSLTNLSAYEAVNPHFAKAIEFIKGNDLSKLPLGRNEICGDLVFANVMEVQPKRYTAVTLTYRFLFRAMRLWAIPLLVSCPLPIISRVMMQLFIPQVLLQETTLM